MQYDQIVKSQTDSPPEFDQQGMLKRRYVAPAVAGATTNQGDASPYLNGKDATGGLAQGYTMVNGQLTYTGTSTPASNPSGAPVLTNDAIASYYNNLRDFNPSTDETAVRAKIQEQMQSALDAIDARYAVKTADEARAGEGRLGRTKALNARSGTMGQDFGNAAVDETKQLNKEQMAAIDAQKAQEQAAIHGQINTLAQQEITARKAEALGKYEGMQKLRENAINLIPQVAASGQELTPAQRDALVRQTGYDPLVFDAIYNNAKNKANQIDYTYHNLGDGKILRTGKSANGTAVPEKEFQYDMPKDSQFTIAPDGTPLIFDKNKGTATIAPGFKQGQFAKPESNGSGITQEKNLFDLRVKQAPSQVAQLKAQGYGWQDIADYFSKLGIDAGNSEIDDALHRAFQNQGEYEAWKQKQTVAKKANASEVLLNTILNAANPDR